MYWEGPSAGSGGASRVQGPSWTWRAGWRGSGGGGRGGPRHKKARHKVGFLDLPSESEPAARVPLLLFEETTRQESFAVSATAPHHAHAHAPHRRVHALGMVVVGWGWGWGGGRVARSVLAPPHKDTLRVLLPCCCAAIPPGHHHRPTHPRHPHASYPRSRHSLSLCTGRRSKSRKKDQPVDHGALVHPRRRQELQPKSPHPGKEAVLWGWFGCTDLHRTAREHAAGQHETGAWRRGLSGRRSPSAL